MGIPTALAIAGVGFSALGSYQEASASKQMAKANAQLATQNAAINEQNAKYNDAQAAQKRKVGAETADDLRRKVNQLQGEQRASYAASGVTLDTGSPLDILGDVTRLGQEDVFKTIDNSEWDAYGSEMDAYNNRAAANQNTNQSSLYRTQASNINPLMSAASTAISGASSIATKWNTFKSK